MRLSSITMQLRRFLSPTKLVEVKLQGKEEKENLHHMNVSRINHMVVVMAIIGVETTAATLGGLMTEIRPLLGTITATVAAKVRNPAKAEILSLTRTRRGDQHPLFADLPLTCIMIAVLAKKLLIPTEDTNGTWLKKLTLLGEMTLVLSLPPISP